MTQLLTSVNLFWLVCGLISHKIFITVSCSFCKLHFHEEYVLVENKPSHISLNVFIFYFDKSSCSFPSLVPEGGVLQRFPVWSLAECDHCGLQEEHVHTVGDTFRARCRWRKRHPHSHSLWDDGIQHSAGVPLRQVLGGIQGVQHWREPQSLPAAWRFV